MFGGLQLSQILRYLKYTASDLRGYDEQPVGKNSYRRGKHGENAPFSSKSGRGGLFAVRLHKATLAPSAHMKILLNLSLKEGYQASFGNLQLSKSCCYMKSKGACQARLWYGFHNRNN
jgi:hypothetical protein